MSVPQKAALAVFATVALGACDSGESKPEKDLGGLLHSADDTPTSIDTDRILAEAAGNNLARWLTTMPPNKLDAVNYADILKTLASDNGWQFKKYGLRELGKLNAGAFLAVAQGNGNLPVTGSQGRLQSGQNGRIAGGAGDIPLRLQGPL